MFFLEGSLHFSPLTVNPHWLFFSPAAQLLFCFLFCFAFLINWKHLLLSSLLGPSFLEPFSLSLSLFFFFVVYSFVLVEHILQYFPNKVPLAIKTVRGTCMSEKVLFSPPT